jgi:hypothetical protein
MRPNIGAAVACILLTGSLGACPEPVEGQEGRQAAPRTGAPLPIHDAMLGEPITFANELETIQCHPIVMSRQVLAWIAAMHVTDDMFLVQRCIELEPDGSPRAGARHGARNARWDEVQLSATDEGLITTPLKLPDWSELSNGVFCGHSVAYWGFRASVVVPTIVDLRTHKVVASEALGPPRPAADGSRLLPQPVWSAACSEATFDGSRTGRAPVKLQARR